MKYLEVVAAKESAPTISAIAEKFKVADVRFGVVGEDGMQQIRLLVDDEVLQSVTDTLQNVLGAQPTARILVLDVESALPKAEEEKKVPEKNASVTREALYEEVEKSARLNRDFMILVVLSTLVADIGLIEDNIAVVIGAMVIAPLLGPNLALSLGTALGDMRLVWQSAKTLSAGIVLAFAISLSLGGAWPSPQTSHELMSRTEANFESVVMALASGAAASLSLTTGLSSVLVGVMVAVALLPPVATFGLLFGAGKVNLAIGAGLLLAINIVCVNLSSNIVLLMKGIRPRTWYEKEKARRAMVGYVAGWCIALISLLFLIYLRRSFIK